MSQDRQIFTLEQVAKSIRKTLENRYKQLYWVKAEMHKLNLYPSGNAFPELVEKNGDKIVAQLTGAIWSKDFQRINKHFLDVVKEPLKEGTTLLMQAKIVYNETYGLRLQIFDIDSSFALGALQRQREETLKKLIEQGLLNRNQELKFPKLPQRIAVISADTSKGLSDFMKIIHHNVWNYKFFTMLFPAYLQGDTAIDSIIGQLERIKKVKDHFDVVVIVRGGGGEVGLTCYNDFELCKNIANFPLPVLTGIGHSTNMTVAELVAFRNAITPSELADFLIQAFHDFSIPINNAQMKIRENSMKILALEKERFIAESKHFKNAANLFLKESKHQLLQISAKFKNSVQTWHFTQNENLKQIIKLINLNCEHLLKSQKKELQNIQNHLISKTAGNLNIHHQKLEQIHKMVHIMDPIQVLKRGYSITTYKGKIIDDQTTINEDASILTKTYNYEITSIVKKINAK